MKEYFMRVSKDTDLAVLRADVKAYVKAYNGRFQEKSVFRIVLAMNEATENAQKYGLWGDVYCSVSDKGFEAQVVTFAENDYDLEERISASKARFERLLAGGDFGKEHGKSGLHVISVLMDCVEKTGQRGQTVLKLRKAFDK